MKQTIFNIRQTTGKLKQKQGYVFSLPYPKQVLFAVAKEGNSINCSIRWVVSEFTTGLAVAFGKWDGTRKAVIAKATKRLRQIGAESLKQQIDIVITKQDKAN